MEVELLSPLLAGGAGVCIYGEKEVGIEKVCEREMCRAYLLVFWSFGWKMMDGC